MGNRAVIVSYDTTKQNASKKLGIYLHWYGNEDNIKGFLDEAKERRIRTIDQDRSYFWARFTQTITDLITEEDIDYNKRYPNCERSPYELSVGIDVVTELDTHNGDNGVYYIKDFEIVKHTDGSEFE